MNTIFYATLIGALVGAMGTGIGAVATFFIKVKSNRISAALMGISGGIMLAIVLFDMLPESLEAAAWHWTFVFFILGALAVLIVNKLLPHYDVPSEHDDSIIQGLKEKRLVRSGLLLALGIGVHNLPEGLALGSGLTAAAEFGTGLAVLLFVHNIPEGMGLAIPLKLGKVPYGKIFLIAAAAAAPMAVGALIGAAMGDLSPVFFAGSVSFGGGAMLYLTLRELIPEAIGMYKSAATWISIAAGVFIGFVLVVLL